MLSIYFKEISNFFSSLTGYVVLVIFLLLSGSFMWVFSETNVFNYNYASLGQFFSTAPLVLLFLIPAVTMQSFAEEKRQGTMEFLTTQPLTDLDIILGKFFACLSLVVLALLPTLVYYWSIHNLGSPVGNIDDGAVIGSYMGLIFLAGVFVAVGLLVSSLTSNQIVAFIGSAFLCFLLYFAFGFISDLPMFFGSLDEVIQYFGIEYHYDNISKGRIDTRDVIYFLSFVGFILWLTYVSLQRRLWN